MTNEQMKAMLASIASNLQSLKEDECIRDTGLGRFAEVRADIATLIAAPAPAPVQAPPGEFETNVMTALNMLRDDIVENTGALGSIGEKIDASETVLATILHNTTAAT